MTASSSSSDSTRIHRPSSPSKKIPEQFQASVVLVEGYAEGMEYPIQKSSAVIGRNTDAAIPLRDPLASREHAVILYHDGSFFLKDLDSTNGTHMRGVSIRQRKLRHGDKFRVGDTVLQFILQDSGRSRTYEIG